MSNVVFEIINDEEEIINKIEGFENKARKLLMKIEDLYYEDLYFMSIADKSIKLINSFIFAFKEKNLTVLAILTRVQIDCACRAFASTLVEDRKEFCKNVLFNKSQINRMVDKNNNRMTDRYLCEQIGLYLDLPVYDLYEKVCDFVHFSSSSFYNIARIDENCDISLFISRKNNKEDEENFDRLSVELASQFYFWGLVLIDDILVSWIDQRKNL